MMNRILIVDGDPQPSSVIAEVASRYGEEVMTVRSADAALGALAYEPDLVLVDGGLRGDSTRRIAAAAARNRPAPIVVVLGVNDTPEESFRLHELGVRGYVSKRAPRETLLREIERARTVPPNLIAFAVASVGKAPMQSVVREVRRTMLDQALGLSRGSRSGAARLLSISRQAVQQIVRERERRSAQRRATVTSLPAATAARSGPLARDPELRRSPLRDQPSSSSSSSAIV